MKKYYIYTIVSFFVLAILTGCDKKTEYDIAWPQPVISNVSSYNSELSSTITLTGNFDKVTKVYFGTIEGENLKVSADKKSLTVVVPRSTPVDGVAISVLNDYKQTSVTTKNFVPVVPMTSVSAVSDIQVGFSFTVTGVNVDLLTEIQVNGMPVTILSKTLNSITVSASGLPLKAGALAEVSFKSLAKNTIATSKNINVIYLLLKYSELNVFSFEAGTNKYTGEGTASVVTGDVKGTQAKYFSLRAPGYGWDKATGTMSFGSVIDISSIATPYLTFLYRTPKGSKGYFQAEIDGAWRHFGYGFDTDGEWVLYSEPLTEKWEGAGWKAASFNPTLGFKAGNAGTKQDIDIAYVKITEGKFTGTQKVGDVVGGSKKAPKLVVMDFENASEWPNLTNGELTVGSLDFRKNDITPFVGTGFYSFANDPSVGAWGGYWGQSLSKNTKSLDLSAFSDPYLSFAFNTIDKPQYLIVRIYQYDEKLVLIQKFFPTTSGKWETAQFSLFNTELENWSKNTTDLEKYYQTLKRFVKGVAIDRIEVIACRNDNNTVGVSVDEMVITEGPRY